MLLIPIGNKPERTIIYGGKIKELNKQWIETKFVLRVLPIPITSVLVTEKNGWYQRSGFYLRLNWKSLLAAYIKILCGIVWIPASVIILISFPLCPEVTLRMIILAAIWVLPAAGVYAYFHFLYGRSGDDEIEQRTKLGKATGLYALPEWLEKKQAREFLDTLVNDYVRSYNSDWQKDLAAEHISVEKVHALYGLAAIAYQVSPTEEGRKMLDKIDALYAV